jgi:hypothetical protein
MTLPSSSLPPLVKPSLSVTRRMAMDALPPLRSCCTGRKIKAMGCLPAGTPMAFG